MERDELTMLLATNIQARMAQRGTNAAQLARAAGMNATAVYDILSGKSRNPRLDTIHKIARELGVTVQHLLREKSDDKLRDDISAVLDSLPDEDRRRLLVTAQAWIAQK
ncbi:helix-turn-helix domain-containing protein [Phaeobacter inhibens]|uniref:helix-turn-helix domain-containing protein n=1 Tax=Phaeobacter inhibens TaxID=221822 RepID=UPI000C9CB3FF